MFYTPRVPNLNALASAKCKMLAGQHLSNNRVRSESMFADDIFMDNMIHSISCVLID